MYYNDTYYNNQTGYNVVFITGDISTVCIVLINVVSDLYIGDVLFTCVQHFLVKFLIYQKNFLKCTELL